MDIKITTPNEHKVTVQLSASDRKYVLYEYCLMLSVHWSTQLKSIALMTTQEYCQSHWHLYPRTKSNSATTQNIEVSISNS